MIITGAVPQLRTTDLTSSIRFYTTILGLQLEFRYEDFYAGIRAGNQVFHLKLVDERDPSIRFVDDGEHFHLYLDTDDIAAAAGILKAKGVSLVRDLHDTPWGTREIVIKDDQGHTLYLGQRRDAADGHTDAIERLERFADAWNRHDLDVLMEMMTDDCVFQASAGPEVNGRRSVGKEAVRAAYAAVFHTFSDAHWADARHFVTGNRAVSEWTFTGTQKDGTRVEVTGCDLFTLRDGKIAVKNSYRKNQLTI